MTNIERDIGKILSRLEDHTGWMKKIDKVLSGNGQKGLVQEFNQYKGGLKILAYFVGLTIPTMLFFVIKILIGG